MQIINITGKDISDFKFTFNWNTLSYITLYLLFLLDCNNCNYITAYKLFIFDTNTGRI